MSLAFSDTTNKNGIIQHIERELGFNDGEISGNATRLAHFTSDVNLSIDDVTEIQNEVAREVNPDDVNHPRYPIVEANIVAGQYDYPITEDNDGNLITDIIRVQAKPTSTAQFETLTEVDQTTRGQYKDLFGNGDTGAPRIVDRTANSIFVWPTPDTTIAAGFRVFVNREGSYFTSSATTLKPGYAPSFHYYSVLHPCEKYARIHGLSNHTDLLNAKLLMRSDLKNHYLRQTTRERAGLTANVESTR